MARHSWPFGAYPAGGFSQLGPHVTAFYADVHPLSNSTIVRGRDAALVFDANLLRHARRIRAALDSAAGPPLTHLVLSHHHADHAHGAMHFAPPARTWARAFARERLAYSATQDLTPVAENYAKYYPDALEEYRALRIVIPEEVVEKEHTFDLGGVQVHVFAQPIAHTAGDLWALVEPDGVVLCGDLWCNDMEPFVGQGSLRGELEAIDRFRNLQAGVYVPGHGPAARIAARGQDRMERYCVWLMEAVSTAVGRGLPGDELKKAIRVQFDDQAQRPRGISFAYPLAGALEESAAAEATVLAGQL